MKKYGLYDVVPPHAAEHLIDLIPLRLAEVAKGAAREGRINWQTLRLEVGQNVLSDPFETGSVGVRISVEVEDE